LFKKWWRMDLDLMKHSEKQQNKNKNKNKYTSRSSNIDSKKYMYNNNLMFKFMTLLPVIYR
tara:strand:- start:35 stop:217 length:183 start_codon:yes stop_codon:yes gene_type:complete